MTARYPDFSTLPAPDTMAGLKKRRALLKLWEARCEKELKSLESELARLPTPLSRFPFGKMTESELATKLGLATKLRLSLPLPTTSDLRVTSLAQVMSCINVDFDGRRVARLFCSAQGVISTTPQNDAGEYNGGGDFIGA